MTFSHLKTPGEPDSAFTVNVMWPVKDIKKQECISSDFLQEFND